MKTMIVFKVLLMNVRRLFCGYIKKNGRRDLLIKFGNTITLIDATYKTTKCEVALFFLCVKTNVGYVEFVVSSESAHEIAEALSILKKWNPDWNPAFFMSDYSEAEFIAVEQVFPSSCLYICDFQNYKMNPAYRAYSEQVPEYLRGWPPALIEHCLSRLQKAKRSLPLTPLSCVMM